MRTRTDRSSAPSRAVLGILFALGDRELHGYGIMKEVEERTGGRVSLLPTSLYATVKRMLSDGLVEEVPAASDDGPGKPKRLYRITDAGRTLARQEAERLEALLGLARANRLGPSETVSGTGA
jgi:DNA-binding PadR family transcriptional regulator